MKKEVESKVVIDSLRDTVTYKNSLVVDGKVIKPNDNYTKTVDYTPYFKDNNVASKYVGPIIGKNKVIGQYSKDIVELDNGDLIGYKEEFDVKSGFKTSKVEYKSKEMYDLENTLVEGKYLVEYPDKNLRTTLEIKGEDYKFKFKGSDNKVVIIEKKGNEYNLSKDYANTTKINKTDDQDSRLYDLLDVNSIKKYFKSFVPDHINMEYKKEGENVLTPYYSNINNKDFTNLLANTFSILKSKELQKEYQKKLEERKANKR